VPPAPADRFLELLPTIDALSAALARRRGLVGADAEDFAAHVRAQFVESEYAALRQFRGEAAITTYLSVVIASWLRAYLFARDGRWRPSAAAIRLGPVAVQLERLVTRGGRTGDEAIAELLAGGDQPYIERELRSMLRALPMRLPMRPEVVAGEHAREVPSPSASDADARLEAGEHDLAVARARRALEASLQTLPPDDRLLVSMRFLDGLSVADIARTLRMEQKPLYRRLERALTALRQQLESLGVTADAVHDVVGRAE
jgi:RNA polymerase sigma factor for flagellar operon FliA